MYKVLITETIAEFRHFLHRIEQPSNLCGHLDNGTQCPACFSVSLLMMHNFWLDVLEISEIYFVSCFAFA